MSTCRTVAREALAGAVLIIVLSLLLDPHQLLLHAPGLHPIWLPILLITARYGERGLLLSFPLCWSCVAVVAALRGISAGLASDTLTRHATPVVVTGLSAVAWMASMHLRRYQALEQQHKNLVERCNRDGCLLEELHRVAQGLQERATRTEHALGFIKHVATRLDGSDAREAAQAALELVAARTGARCTAILVMKPDGLWPWKMLGPWNVNGSAPPCTVEDATAQSALTGTACFRKKDDQDPHHCDAAAPIPLASGRVAAVLVVRGLPHSMQMRAVLHDVELVAQWFSSACMRSGSGVPASAPALPAVHPIRPPLDPVRVPLAETPVRHPENATR